MNGALWMIRLYAGDSSARSIRVSTDFRTRARLSYSCCGASSNLDACRRGSSHVSNGNRGAYGASATMSAVLLNDAGAVRHLLADDVAEDAPLLRREMPPGALDLLAHEVGHDRQRDQLRVRVLERGAGDGALVLEDKDVAKPAILPEIQHALAEGRQHALDLDFGHRRECLVVIGRLDDHFVRADAVHPVEHPVAFAIEPALDLQRRKLVRARPARPSRASSARRRSAGTRALRAASALRGRDRRGIARAR